MKVALIASYDKLIEGLGIAVVPANQTKLTAIGWTTDKYKALKKSLEAIQAAEHSLYASTHGLSERISEAQGLLEILDNAFEMAEIPRIYPTSESSYRYSTSMSSSSSLPWRYNSGSVWVTTSSSCAVPDSSGPYGTSGAAALPGASPSKHARKKPAAKAVKSKTAKKKSGP